MTARAIGVFALVLALASPAMAGPANSTIGAKKLEESMVHSGGVGYPSVFYEFWKRGKKKMDWGVSGELVYGDWAAARGGRSGFRNFGLNFNVLSGEVIRIGLGLNGMLRWNVLSKQKAKVTNDFAILFKPGILLAGNNYGNAFTFAFKGEIGLPLSIDVHERVSIVTGGFLPFVGYFNQTNFAFAGNTNINFGEVPILIRLGVEIDAAERVAPWFFFDLGPGIRFGEGVTDTAFAWRIGAGTAFWGVLGKNKNKSNSAASSSAEPVESTAEPIE